MATWHQEFFAAVGKWPWLENLNDSVSGVVQPVYDRFRGNLAVELLHGGRWAGHALHPALSDLPIGFWAGSCCSTIGGDPAPKGKLDPAGTFTAAGIAAAVATAVTGVADWTVSDDEDRRVGLFHGVLNEAASALQGVSLAARLSGHRGSARALGMAAWPSPAAAASSADTSCGPRRDGQPGGGATRPDALGPGRGRHELPDNDAHGRRRRGPQDPAVPRGRDRPRVDNVCSHAGGLLSRGAGRGPDRDLPAARVSVRLADGPTSAVARPTSRSP